MEIEVHSKNYMYQSKFQKKLYHFNRHELGFPTLECDEKMIQLEYRSRMKYPMGCICHTSLERLIEQSQSETTRSSDLRCVAADQQHNWKRVRYNWWDSNSWRTSQCLKWRFTRYVHELLSLKVKFASFRQNRVSKQTLNAGVGAMHLTALGLLQLTRNQPTGLWFLFAMIQACTYLYSSNWSPQRWHKRINRAIFLICLHHVLSRTFVIEEPDRQVRKASHCGSKQQ